MNSLYPSTSHYETLAFPEGDFDGPVIDPPGYTVYNLFTNRRFFASDTTSITKPNGTSVAVIVWGSIWAMERRKILFHNMTISARKFLTYEILGSSRRWFRAGDGRFFYWRDLECYDGTTRALVATCKQSINGVPTLSVHWAYCGPAVLDFIIITCLLMKKKVGVLIGSRWLGS